MMDSKDLALTPSIVISPADGLTKGYSNLRSSMAISIKQTTTTSTSGSETYEYNKKTEVRHYSTSSEPSSSLSPEKTAESQTSSPTEVVAEDGASAESDAGTNCAPSSPAAATTPEDANVTVRVEALNRFEVAGRRRRNKFASDIAIASMYREDMARKIHMSSSPPNNAPSPSNSSRSAVHVGLVNQAMTCYLNSLIQALFMTPEFRNALYKWEFTGPGSGEEEQHSIPFHLQKLFLNLQTSQRNAVETTKLTRSFGWDSSEAWHQHDIQELCRVMFEALERKFSNTDQADFIQRLYEGKMIDYVKCLQCCKEKSREDSFLDIPLPVKPFGNPVAYETIEEALDGFVQAETLDGNNQYFCETCNKKCDAQKGLKFSHFPYILTLHLKRFDFDYNTMHRIKLNDKVVFPEVLNLNDYVCGDRATGSDTSAMIDPNSTCSTNGDGCLSNGCQNSSCNELKMCSCSDSDEGLDENTKTGSKTCPIHKNEINSGSPGPYKYELFSIMIHSGSASGGHYFAYIKDFDTNEWFCFNDDVVSPISHEDIVENFCSNNRNRYFGFSSTPYMLMYRQIDKKKNASFMKPDEFPDHIKKLVEVVLKEDEEQPNRRIRRRGPYRQGDLDNDCEQAERVQTNADDDTHFMSVHFAQGSSEKKIRWVMFSNDETLYDFLNVTAELFGISDVLLPKLRLAVCTPGVIGTSSTLVPVVEEIIGQPSDLVKNFIPDNKESYLLLSVEEYAPEEGDVSVQLVSLDTSEVIGFPVELAYTKGMKISQLKEKIAVLIDDMPLNRIYIVSSREGSRNDDLTVQEAKSQCSKFFAVYTETRDMDSEEAQRCITILIMEILSRSVVEVKCQFFGISSRLLTRFGKNGREIAKSGWKKRTAALRSGQNGERANEDVVLPHLKKALNDNESASTNLDLKSIARSALEDQNSATNSLPLQNGTEDETPSNRNGAKENSPGIIFTVNRVDEVERELLLNVSSEMGIFAFKDMLARFVGLPAEYNFKLYSHPKDRKECVISNIPIGDLTKSVLENLCVKIVKPTETSGVVLVNWKIHSLDPKLWMAVHIFVCAMSKSITVYQAKKIIIEEMQERGFDAPPLDRCRLRDVVGSRPKNVFLDDLTLRELYSTSYDILIQDREGPEPVTTTLDNLIMVQNFDRREDELGKEIVVENSPTPEEEIENFYQKLSLETGIPVKNLDVRILYLSCALYRHWRREDFEDSATQKLIDSGHAFFYRDNREPLGDADSTDLWDEYMPVQDYLEGKNKMELEPRTENSSENAENPKRDRRLVRRRGPKRNLAHWYMYPSRDPKNDPNGDQSDNVTNHVESSEPPKETPAVKSYRSKERGLKIYVEPTPQRSTPESVASP